MKPRAMPGAVCTGLAVVLPACTSPGGNVPPPAAEQAARHGENITPVVSREAVARFGTRLLTVLDAVSERLTTDSLRALDAQVELAGREPRLVAGDWLRAHGLMPEGGVMR